MKGKKAFIMAVCLLGLNILPAAASCQEKWVGVDESVVEKYAKEHGRGKRVSYINTDQGDMLLFVFLIAGVVGGFGAGYCWRMLNGEKCKVEG